MKLCIVLPSLLGGGAERMHILLANQWIRDGYQVDIILISSLGEVAGLRALADPKINIISLNCHRLRESAVPLGRKLKQNNYSAILVAMWPLTIIAIVAKILAFSNSKLVISDHTHLSTSRVSELNVPLWYLKFTIRIFYRFADYIVGVSEGVKRDLISLGGIPSKKIKVIYNPVATSNYTKTEYDLQEVEKLWGIKKRHRILSVGSLKEQKNFHNLINAFDLLPNEIKTDAVLIILGEGELRNELESLIKLKNLDKNIFLLGYQVNPSPWFDSATLFVLPSSWEGFGNVLVEALQSCLPIVSTDCKSGPSEILDHGRYGELVEINNPQSLADGIIASISKKHDQNALYHRSQAFTIKEASKKYLELFGEH